jgi:predicted PurR-regulated permease PerM
MKIVDNFTSWAKSRTRTGWKALVRDSYTEMRIWLQENGEKAFVIGLMVGFALIVFFKLFAFLFALGIILGVLVWELATDSHECESEQSQEEKQRKSE